MLIELRDHPTQARHPITNEPLIGEDGRPVPAFPDDRSVWLDGVSIGYTSVTGPITLITAVSPTIATAIIAHVESELGHAPRKLAQPLSAEDLDRADQASRKQRKEAKQD